MKKLLALSLILSSSLALADHGGADCGDKTTPQAATTNDNTARERELASAPPADGTVPLPEVRKEKKPYGRLNY